MIYNEVGSDYTTEGLFLRMDTFGTCTPPEEIEVKVICEI